MAIEATETRTPPRPCPPRRTYERYEAIFGDLEPPFAYCDLDAVWSNAAEMLDRAGGKPIRVASKSVRCRDLLARILERDPGFRGLLTFTLPESLWLADEGFEDLVCAYPTADRTALGELARLTEAEPDRAPVVMVDSVAHLDLIESAAAGRGRRARAGARLHRARRRLVAARRADQDRAEALARAHPGAGARAGAGDRAPRGRAPGRA